MPTQNSIADILSVGSRVDQHRASARASDGGAAFQQAFRQSHTSRNPPGLSEPSASNREPSAFSREPSASHREPSASYRDSALRSDREAQDAHRETSRSPAHADSGLRSQRTDSASSTDRPGSTTRTTESRRDTDGTSGQVDSKNPAELAEKASESETDVSAVLKKLADGEWQSLTEDMDTILTELKSALDSGELPEELTAALQELLADLESGAPLEDIIAGLDAIPINVLPELASQFPGAQTLKDVLGRSGAAYLSQLGKMLPTQEASSERHQSASLLNVSQATEAEPSSLDQLLALNKTVATDTKTGMGALVEALVAKATTESAKPQESAASAQNVAATAQLEGGSRAQPLSPAERQFTIHSEVRVPVGQAQWGQAVGERVLWLASQKLGSAELRLDPPDLGPVHVRVSSHNDQISVTFTSPQSGVRDALDQSANRLREMFSEQGLNLVDVNVSDQSGEQSLAEEGQHSGGGRSGGEDDNESESGQVTVLRSNYLVDHYA